jgi:hypothetical protein
VDAITGDIGLPLHYNISMDPSLHFGVRDGATTIRTFDRDVALIRGYNGVLAVSIPVFLADNKRWRQLAAVHDLSSWGFGERRPLMSPSFGTA